MEQKSEQRMGSRTKLQLPPDIIMIEEREKGVQNLKKSRITGICMLGMTALLMSGCRSKLDPGRDALKQTEITESESREETGTALTEQESGTETAEPETTQSESETETETETEQVTWMVAIDAGHQGSWVDMSEPEPVAPGSSQTKAKASVGTTGRFSGVAEYELNLQVAQALKKELVSRGYGVVMTREDHDTAISNRERAELATREGADISVRIHANGSDDPSVSGALTMAPSVSNPYLSQEVIANSSKLSSEILKSYCEATGLANLGVMATDEMTGINWSTVPVTILEMGFMTNQQDDLYLTTEANHETMAKGIADGIDAYFAGMQPETAQNAGTEKEGQNMTLLSEILEGDYLNPLLGAGEKWSVAVRDLTGGDTCMVYADQQLQSASVIKAFIMATVYERAVFAAEAGREMIDMGEAYDGELRDLLTNMITVSDNEASNELVRRLGQGDFEAGAAVVNEFCQDHGYVSTHLGRMFLAENPTDDNYTSAADCCRLLTEIYRGELISEEASGRMKELLLGQTRTGKIPAGVPEGVITANKTGEMPPGYGYSTIENDIALVLDEQKPYVICVLSNDIRDNGAAQQTITGISSEVYRYLCKG